MDLMHLRIFQRHVADQSGYALFSVDHINQALQTQNMDLMWYGCQQFLASSANVSKALWGQRGRLTAQREPLRSSLGVDNDSVLKATTFRNNFEHYDERIDRWWKESEAHHHADKMVGPPDMIRGLDPLDRFRFYDPESHRIIFWGEEFAVEPIAKALAELNQRATQEAQKPHWEP